MAEIVLPHVLSHKQHEFMVAPGRHLLFSGGVGSGKTLALAYRAFYLAMKYPGSVGMLCMWTYPQLKDILLPALDELLMDLPRSAWKWEATAKNYTFSNGSVWRVRQLENEMKVRGTSVDYIGIDELTVGISESIYNQLKGRIRRGKWGCIFSATNPDSKQHWAYRNWFKHPEEGYTLIEATTRDNKHLPTEYTSDLERNSEEWKRQFLAGEWGTMVGAMFDLQRDIHILDRAAGGKWYLSFDWGFKVDDWVCLLICVEDGHVHVVDEINARKMHNEELVPTVRTMLQRHGNPSLAGMTADNGGELAPKSIRFWRDLLKIRNISTDKARQRGWVALQRWLYVDEHLESRLTIAPRCERTIESLQSMKWSDKVNDALEGDDHNTDALRYFVMSRAAPKLKVEQ